MKFFICAVLYTYAICLNSAHGSNETPHFYWYVPTHQSTRRPQPTQRNGEHTNPSTSNIHEVFHHLMPGTHYLYPAPGPHMPTMVNMNIPVPERSYGSGQNQYPRYGDSERRNSAHNRNSRESEDFATLMHRDYLEDLQRRILGLNLNSGLNQNRGSFNSHQSSGEWPRGLQQTSTERQRGQYDIGVLATPRMRNTNQPASSSGHHVRSPSDLSTNERGQDRLTRAMNALSVLNQINRRDSVTPEDRPVSPPAAQSSFRLVEISQADFLDGYKLLHADQGRATGIFVRSKNQFYTKRQLKEKNPQPDPVDPNDRVMDGGTIIATRGADEKWWQKVKIRRSGRFQQ